jgi:hypothetical protein
VVVVVVVVVVDGRGQLLFHEMHMGRPLAEKALKSSDIIS